MTKLLLLLATCILIAGCDIKQPESAIFLRNDLDLSAVSRVAVLPFENQTGIEYNARRMREIFITELLASGKFEVVDRETVDAALSEITKGTGKSPDAPVLKILAKKLEVNAFLTGTMNKVEGRAWGEPRYPEISFTLHLIDAETARLLWRSTAYRNAYSDNRLLKVEPKGTFEITRKLLQDMIASIPK